MNNLKLGVIGFIAWVTLMLGLYYVFNPIESKRLFITVNANFDKNWQWGENKIAINWKCWDIKDTCKVWKPYWWIQRGNHYYWKCSGEYGGKWADCVVRVLKRKKVSKNGKCKYAPDIINLNGWTRLEVIPPWEDLYKIYKVIFLCKWYVLVKRVRLDGKENIECFYKVE